MSPRQLFSVLLLISLLSTHLSTCVSSLSFSYDFSSQPHYNTKDLNLFYLNTTTSLDLHGLHGDTVCSKGIRSIGRVLHTQPVLLWDNVTGDAASFSMTFCFRMQQQTGAGGAPRMSVFLVPYYPSSAPPTTISGNSRSVATDGDDQIEEVEFDATLTRSSSTSSPSSSTSCRSSTPPWSLAGDTTSQSAGGEGTVFAHIGYDHRTQMLTKSVRIGGAPCRSINSTVDQRRSMPSEVAVGFSSTTGHPIQMHNILLWSFNSTLETKTRSSLMQPEETVIHQAPVITSNERYWICRKQLLVRLDPWNRSLEFGLGFQFQRSWVRLKLVLNSKFNISLEYGIGNEWD